LGNFGQLWAILGNIGRFLANAGHFLKHIWQYFPQRHTGHTGADFQNFLGLPFIDLLTWDAAASVFRNEFAPGAKIWHTVRTLTPGTDVMI
jgi:hypothetical protein